VGEWGFGCDAGSTSNRAYKFKGGNVVNPAVTASVTTPAYFYRLRRYLPGTRSRGNADYPVI
jgi:hypothetical protein